MKDTDPLSEPTASWERQTQESQNVMSMEEANRVLRQKPREQGALTLEAGRNSVSEDRGAKMARPASGAHRSTAPSVSGKSADAREGSPGRAQSLRPVTAEKSRCGGRRGPARCTHGDRPQRNARGSAGLRSASEI